MKKLLLEKLKYRFSNTSVGIPNFWHFIAWMCLSLSVSFCHNPSIGGRNITAVSIAAKNKSFLPVGEMISYNGVENLIIGDSIKKIWILFPKDRIEYFEGYGYVISENDTIQMLISSKDNHHITSLEFFSPNYYTKSGVYVGSSIEDVKKLYKEFWITLDEMDTNLEYFNPSELTVKKDGVCYVTSITFSNKAKNEKTIGKYESFAPGERTFKFKKNATVRSILIFLPDSDGLKCE